MGITGKTITKITPHIFKLLMEIVEQKDPNISHSSLMSEAGRDVANFLLKENYLTKGCDSNSFWLGDEDVNVEWNEELQSYVYLSCSGKFIAVNEEELKTYDIDIDKIVNFLAKEFDVLESSKTNENKHLKGILYFAGNAHVQKKKISIFFARRLNDRATFKKIEEFFIKPITSFPTLILTSSNHLCPEVLKSGTKIISITNLLGLANGKDLFNFDYVANVIFGCGSNEVRPYIYCSEDGSILHVGNKNWNVGGDKQRQVIKIMCDNYLKNPDQKMRWNSIINEADMETQSRFQDMFKNSAVKEAIDHDKGLVWFKF